MTDSTPAADPASTPASPAPNTGSSAPTVNTLGDARSALESADSSPATPATDLSSPASAEVSPDAATDVSASTPPDDPRSPVIPRARFDEVNTRMQAAETQLHAFAWAKDIPDDVRPNLSHAISMYRALDQDPVGTIAALTQHAASNPHLAAALRSQMGRLLATGRPPAAPDEAPEPQADLQTQDGTPVYSATQTKAWQEWNTRRLTSQLRAQFEQRLQPLAQVAQTFQQREAQALAVSTVTQALTAFKADNPEYTDAYRDDLRAAIANDPRLSAVAETDPALAIETAWARVYRAKVLPEQQKHSEGTMLANLQQRAVAATINPASATPTTPASTLGNARAALLAAGVE